MNLCRDCRHYSSGISGSLCFSPRRVKWSPVHGIYAVPRRALSAREDSADCGFEGAWFERSRWRKLVDAFRGTDSGSKGKK